MDELRSRLVSLRDRAFETSELAEELVREFDRLTEPSLPFDADHATARPVQNLRAL